MQRDIYSTALPWVFASALAIPALYGLSTTEGPAPDLSVLSGAYQRAYEDRFADTLPLNDVARGAMNALTLAAFGQTGPDVVIGDDQWLFTAEEFRPATNAVPLTETLQTVQETLANQGITLIPVIVPDKARVYADKLPRERGAQLETRFDTARDTLSELGFPAIDLNSALTEARGAEDTFLRTDTHWSPFGADQAAQVIAQDAGLAGLGNLEFEVAITPDQPFRADLMPFVETGPFARWAGIAEETINLSTTTTVAQPSAGLFGDVEVGIVLVGTSFSARTEFDFAGALSRATGLDVVNLSVEGQGPFAPMTDALTTGAIQDLAPQFVVWEIPERYL
ncbi:alginate O-acetyltransferase AlgX-related protein [Shimia ponticola]|uniref:alginate O-acetyltransferase AlgX-related protein n=1 Tax=Shimia ponticola TaxID=2582893 RepID=UPI0011BE5646|nr:hypothetical protein [Shimia ponticola]